MHVCLIVILDTMDSWECCETLKEDVDVVLYGCWMKQQQQNGKNAQKKERERNTHTRYSSSNKNSKPNTFEID